MAHGLIDSAVAERGRRFVGGDFSVNRCFWLDGRAYYCWPVGSADLGGVGGLTQGSDFHFKEVIYV